MKKKEPYPNLSWPLYILFVGVGCILAKVLLDVFVSRYDGILNNIYVYDVLLLLYGLFMCLIVYQLGRFIFGKIAGFDVLLVNLILIGFKKVNGKWVVYNGLKESLSLKVEMVPSENKKQNVVLFLLGGGIMTLVALTITYLLVFLLPSSNALKGFFTLSSLFYGFSLLAYLAPVKLDSVNDGFSLLLIKKYKLLDTYLRNRRNLRAMYDPSYELEYDDTLLDHNDPISMEARLNNYYYALRKDDKELIIKECSMISENYKFVVGEEDEAKALIARIYLLCLNEDFETLKDLYWKLDAASRRIIVSTRSLESLKTGLYISSKIDESREGLLEITKAIESCAKKYRFEGQKESEIKLINSITESIYKENPDLKLLDNTSGTLN